MELLSYREIINSDLIVGWRPLNFAVVRWGVQALQRKRDEGCVL